LKKLTESQWKWADLLIKALGVAIISALISVFGIISQNSRERIALDATQRENALARAERKLNALVQFGSAQKKLDVDVGMSLFKTFVENYLKLSAKSSSEIRQTIVMLRLIALNFQDVPINLKPLFEDLDARLELRDQACEQNSDFAIVPGGIDQQIDATIRKELRDQLRDVAKEVANRQAFRMTFLAGKLSDVEGVKAGDVTFFEDVPFAIQVEKIEKDNIRILVQQTELDKKGEPILIKAGKTIGPFSLSYFDMPLLDNIKIYDTTRISVILQKIENDQAFIRKLNFSSDLAADRFDIKEMSRKIVEEENK
jgi:hypothetical protein